MLLIYVDCNKKQEDFQGKVDKLTLEEKAIMSRQAELKMLLYNKFGNSINLES